MAFEPGEELKRLVDELMAVRGTLATGSLDPETDARLAREYERSREVIERVEIVLSFLFQGRQRGEITDGELIEFCYDVVQVEGLVDYMRRKYLGEAVIYSRGLSSSPRIGRGPRRRPLWRCEIAYVLVKCARADGYPIARGTARKQTAFMRAAEVMRLRAGIKSATASSVEKDYFALKAIHRK